MTMMKGRSRSPRAGDQPTHNKPDHDPAPSNMMGASPLIGSGAVSPAPTSMPETAPHPVHPKTKRALVQELLRREDGATLAELMTATGWQAHSVRAALTGLRKSGSVLEKSIRNGATCYQILDASDARG